MRKLRLLVVVVVVVLVLIGVALRMMRRPRAPRGFDVLPPGDGPPT